MSQISQLAYQNIADKIPKRRRKVFEQFVKNPRSTVWEIADLIGWNRNEVSGRVTELRQSFLIVECGTKQNHETNQKNTVYTPIESEVKRTHLINTHISALTHEVDAIQSDLDFGLVTPVSRKELQKRVNKLKINISRLQKLIQ